MSWHPYERKSRLWSVYWQKKPVSQSDPTEFWQVELTEPYALDRDDWRKVQIWLFQHLTPPDYTLNISQLWYRNWPDKADTRYTRIEEFFQVPITLSQESFQPELPYRHEGYFWVLVQTKPREDIITETIWHHAVDFENITWITPEPIQPFPAQLYEFNKVALGHHNKEVTNAELDTIIKQEAWGLITVHLSHVLLRIPTANITEERLWEVINETAAQFKLYMVATPAEKRPRRPPFIKGLAKASVDLTKIGWDTLTGGLRKS